MLISRFLSRTGQSLTIGIPPIQGLIDEARSLFFFGTDKNNKLEFKRRLQSLSRWRGALDGEEARSEVAGLERTGHLRVYNTSRIEILRSTRGNNSCHIYD